MPAEFNRNAASHIHGFEHGKSRPSPYSRQACVRAHHNTPDAPKLKAKSLLVSTTQVIQRAHKDIPLLELTASRAEAELGECQRMLDMRKEADRRLRHWQDMLAEAKTDLTHAEMRLAGQVRSEGKKVVPRVSIFQRKRLSEQQGRQC